MLLSIFQYRKKRYCVSLHLKLCFSQLSSFLWLPTCCDLFFSHLCLSLLASYSIFCFSPQHSASNFLQLFNQTYPVPSKDFDPLSPNIVIGRSNRFGFQVNEWRQWSHKILIVILSVSICTLVSNNMDEASSTSGFFFSSLIL